ncbi:aldo/keto reductase family oxidoreductase [Pseudoduganella sp. UC29_106]|uniref:aldo/keto reductase n=1 Tax=Pseudoduganella sp. UC29_106 TaxID=3374553 RepID=UPI003757D5BC
MNKLNLSPIVAGMWRMTEWNLAPEQRLAFIEQCIELGVTSFDHADIYGGYGVEGLFGEALALKPSLRDQIQLVSKCGIKLKSSRRPAHTIQHYDTSAAHIRASVENSLKELRTDYLDLLLIHRPDPLMDFDEVANIFSTLHAEGKVKEFGVSNFSRHQFEMLHKRIALATNQVEFSPLHLDPMWDETFDGLQDKGIQPMIWSPACRRPPVLRRRRRQRAPAPEDQGNRGRTGQAVRQRGVRVDHAAAVQARPADGHRPHRRRASRRRSHQIPAQPHAVVRNPPRRPRPRSRLI